MNVYLIVVFLLLWLTSEFVKAEQVSRRLQTEKRSRKLSPTRRRPDPSDLIVDDLIEEENPMYDPLLSDINVKQLRRQLGVNFNPDFTSIRDPRKRPGTTDPSSATPKGPLPNYLHLTRNARPQDGKRLKLNVTKESRKRIQNYLWNYNYCPVQHTWKLLNVRFWPRWVKVGTCLNRGSCSFPPGMTCQPDGGEFLHILRWNCRDFKNRIACQWINVSFSILTECKCSCGESGFS